MRDGLPGALIERDSLPPQSQTLSKATDAHILARLSVDQSWVTNVQIIVLDEADVLSPASIMVVELAKRRSWPAFPELASLSIHSGS